MHPFIRKGRAPLVSVLIPAHGCPAELRRNVPVLLAFLARHYGKRFEVILVPNPVLQDPATRDAALALARRHRGVRVCLTGVRPGKGLALKEGFGLARGKWIYTTDADLPFDLGFFLEAERLLRIGYHLVVGNRRLPQSRFRMSKRVLHLVYQRVVLGKLFNLFVRTLFPIRTTDTQAGLKAMTRETAGEVFRRQVCPRFSYDIEMFLTVQGMGGRIAELPVELHLRSEESTIRILRTLAHALYWITRIFVLRWKGHYAHAKTA